MGICRMCECKGGLVWSGLCADCCQGCDVFYENARHQLLDAAHSHGPSALLPAQVVAQRIAFLYAWWEADTRRVLPLEIGLLPVRDCG